MGSPRSSWRIHEIVVLSPIQWTSFRRNEINERQSIGKRTTAQTRIEHSGTRLPCVMWTTLSQRHFR